MANFGQVNKIRQIFKDNQIIFFGLLFLIVFLFGIKGKINYTTDDTSEKLLLQEAKLITEGVFGAWFGIPAKVQG